MSSHFLWGGILSRQCFYDFNGRLGSGTQRRGRLTELRKIGFGAGMVVGFLFESIYFISPWNGILTLLVFNLNQVMESDE